MSQHRIGIIGGSGLYNIEGFTNQKWVKIKTPFGAPSDELLTANTRWVKLGDVLLAPGRQRVAQLSNLGVPGGQLTSADALMISLNRRLSEKPTLAHLGSITNGQLAFRLGGNINQRLRIESSTDMANWNSLTNITMPGAFGDITVTTTNAPLRFYRAALAP